MKKKLSMERLLAVVLILLATRCVSQSGYEVISVSWRNDHRYREMVRAGPKIVCVPDQ